MLKILSSITATFVLTTSGLAYDHDQAKKFDTFFSKFSQQACANSKLFISSDETMKMIRNQENYLLLDVRTDGEASVITVSDTKSLHIPIEHLFEEQNLAKLPTDRPILIICHSGTRATMSAIGLKMVGFSNVRVVQGGLISLATDNNPKNAPLK